MVTGKIEAEDFIVENLQLQTLPGLYIAANLYLPKNISKPAPAILYVSGHGPVITNGISYGNKVSYQHHGEWFARNGYVCLVLDTHPTGSSSWACITALTANGCGGGTREAIRRPASRPGTGIRALDYLVDPPGSGWEPVRRHGTFGRRGV